MSDNHTHYFDHIRWHVAAKSGIQWILNFSPDVECKSFARFLKTMQVHHSYITKVRTFQSGICLEVFSVPFTLQSKLFPRPVPQTPADSINSFGCTLDSCTGITQLLRSAAPTSSDKCSWPSWNSINPAQSFPRCECTVFTCVL